MISPVLIVFLTLVVLGVFFTIIWAAVRGKSRSDVQSAPIFTQELVNKSLSQDMPQNVLTCPQNSNVYKDFNFDQQICSFRDVEDAKSFCAANASCTGYLEWIKFPPGQSDLNLYQVINFIPNVTEPVQGLATFNFWKKT